MWAPRNTTPEMLLGNYRAIVNEVPAYYERLGKKGTPLSVSLAEYMHGKNISVDCLMDKTGKVYTTPPVEVLTGRDIGLDDYHHFARILPARMTQKDEDEFKKLAMGGVQALDMTNAAAHVEIIGSRLGEIGARPGGNRPRILELAHGIDLLCGYYQILRGETPGLEPDRDLAAAVVTPFAPRQGTLKELRHLDQLPKLPGYLYHEIRAQPGQQVGPAKGGFRAGIYIELRSTRVETIWESVDLIASWTDLYDLE